MKILSIAYYTILRNFRDKKSLSLTLLFPILLILILGTALSSIYSPKKISKVQVAYVNEDKGEISKQFDKFIKSDKISDLINVKDAASYEAGIDLVKKNKVSSLIFINSNYSSNAQSGKKAEINVYQSQRSVFTSSIVQNIVDSFTSGANTIEAVYKMGSQTNGYNTYKNIKEIPITSNGTVPRSIDYYAVTMLVMTLMYGTLFGSFGMSEDLREKTFIRIKSAPIGPYVNYIGKTLGTIVTLLIETLILILFTKFAYKVNWGSNILAVFLISSLFAVFATGLGIMAYAVTRNAMRASGLLNILVVVFTFISGGYAKINAAGTLFEKFSYISPNKIVQTALFNTIYGGSAHQTQLCILSLAGITLIIFAIASFAGRREFN